MLSERVLDELIRSSALSQELVKALWPDLSAESKLQLLDAYHVDFSPSTPDWLTDLAIDDRSPVVQYFALRHAHLRPRREDVAENLKQFFQTTDEDVARHAKAQALEHPLAKAAVTVLSAFDSKEQLCGASQLERLAHVRNQSSFSLGALVDFLQAAVDRVDDRELAAVAYEYFQRPDTKRELRRDRFDYSDGMSAYYAGQGVTTRAVGGPRAGRSPGPQPAHVAGAGHRGSQGVGHHA